MRIYLNLGKGFLHTLHFLPPNRPSEMFSVLQKGHMNVLLFHSCRSFSGLRFSAIAA